MREERLVRRNRDLDRRQCVVLLAAKSLDDAARRFTAADALLDEHLTSRYECLSKRSGKLAGTTHDDRIDG